MEAEVVGGQVEVAGEYVVHCGSFGRNFWQECVRARAKVAARHRIEGSKGGGARVIKCNQSYIVTCIICKKHCTDVCACAVHT